MKKQIAALSMFFTATCYAGAQGTDMDMKHMTEGAASVASQTLSASSQAFDKVNNNMMNNMSMKTTGNADIDFIKMMMAHHKGAVDMAKVELQYGKDPQARKLAEKIISAQEEEIGQMQQWLKVNDK